MVNKFFMLLIIFMLLTSSIVFSLNLTSGLVGKTIVLDAGHGGVDVGTSYKNIYEKDLNLIIALKLRDKLVKYGVNVILTRDGDFDLSSPGVSRRKKSDFDNRIKLINNVNADLYLSIHFNYLEDSRYYGAQVFFTKSNEELANKIQNQFISDLDSPLVEKELDSSLYMYKYLKVPGVLIECGFLSNVNERNLIVTDDYQDRLVDSIVEALILYY